MNAQLGMSDATYHWEAEFSKQKGHACMHACVNGRLCRCEWCE